ncbi:MAG: tRNA-dihydrouridine synthase family protein, partial [Mailhella sp.]|nr:tRNA-dihydrouridine synthase family protein [Mailhella sp.]
MIARLPIDPDSPWLAPLAGWSDLPFRLLCREQGAAVCCTEMVSAKGLVYGGRNTEQLLATAAGEECGNAGCPSDEPLVVQIFGAEPEFMEQAVYILKDKGFEWFDVNMGCSVPKVTKTGAGAAMLRDVTGALRVARAVIGAAGAGRAGFKLRLGWDRNH